MNERIVISHGYSGILLVNTLKNDLMKRGFYVWDGYHLTPGSDAWWEKFEEVLDNSYALIALISSLHDPTPQAVRQIKAARDRNVQVIPLLFEGVADDLPSDFFTSEIIDISSKDKYETGIETLFRMLYQAFGIDLQVHDASIEREIEQMVIQIPDIRWIRILTVDGFSHPIYRFDYIKRDTEVDREEDRYVPMSVVALSLSERIMSEVGLGNPHFVVLSGEHGTYFLLPVGDGQQWCLSFAVGGHPPVDETLQYFKDREYLDHILPLLSENPFYR